MYLSVVKSIIIKEPPDLPVTLEMFRSGHDWNPFGKSQKKK